MNQVQSFGMIALCGDLGGDHESAMIAPGTSLIVDDVCCVNIVENAAERRHGAGVQYPPSLGALLLAWPDVTHRRNLFAITLPAPFGSLIDSDSLTAGEVGLDSIPRENWPPVVIPFFAFRIMVG
jgi:hypothetical protein